VLKAGLLPPVIKLTGVFVSKEPLDLIQAVANDEAENYAPSRFRTKQEKKQQQTNRYTNPAFLHKV